MCANYSEARAAYFVVEDGGRQLGGGGIGPLAGAGDEVCELHNKYFLPELRGRGIGPRM
jgi:putative acetyltransferase